MFIYLFYFHSFQCVGGGSNAIGMFHPFVNDVQVKIVGVEAAGAGLHTQDHVRKDNLKEYHIQYEGADSML